MTRIAVLTHATEPLVGFVEHLQSAAGSVGVRIQVLRIRGAEGLDGAFAEMVKERASVARWSWR